MADQDKRITVNITTRTLVKVVLVIVVTVLLFNFFSSIKHPLTLIFISFFLALALNPAVSGITKRLKSRSRVRGTAVAYMLVITFLVAFFSLTIPPLVSQTREFIAQVPQTVADFETQDSAIAQLVRNYDLNEKIEDAANDFSNRLGDFKEPIIDTGKRIGGTFISTLAVLVMTFMMLIEGPMWFNRILSLFPANKHERRKKLANDMYNTVTGFVNGQLILVTIGGFFTLITLLIASTLLDVSINAVALAGIVVVLGLIPMIGVPIAAAIVILMSLFSSATLALVMLIFFIVYQQLENVTLQPYIQSKQSQLTPLTVFVAALIGIGFGGILGAIVAIPVAGCAKILIEDYIARKKITTKS